jgi:asparagine synthase (glutamine-hydrolysing)
VSAVSQAELDGYLRNTLLRDTDAMSMAHGLEARAPFLHHQVVAASASVRRSDKIAGPTNKPLLVAAAPELPDVVIRRRKSGFGLPFDARLRGPRRRRASISVENAGHGLSPTEARRIWLLFLDNHRHVSWSRARALIVLASWLRRNGMTAAQ